MVRARVRTEAARRRQPPRAEPRPGQSCLRAIAKCRGRDRPVTELIAGDQAGKSDATTTIVAAVPPFLARAPR